MLKYLLLLAILPMMLIPAFADIPDPSLCNVDNPPHIIVTTEKPTYYTGDTIYVNGIVCDYSIKGVFVAVLNPYSISPIGGYGDIRVNSPNLGDVNTFSASFNSGGAGWNIYEGDYRIKVSGNGYYVEETFEYIIVEEDFVTVTTDKPYYLDGETITISGEVRDLYNGTLAYVRVTSPDSHSSLWYTQTPVGTDKQFSTELIANSTSMQVEGTYTVDVSYGSNYRSGMTTFDFGVPTIPTNSLTITTDNPTYHEDTPIYISGQLNNSHNGTSINISLQSPKGHISPVHNVITLNNNFNTTIPTGNNTSISTPGLYTLTAHYGTETASVSFDYYVNSHDTQEAYFIPDSSYLTLSDQEITKWNGELSKWQNAQNRTDSNIELYYEKLDEAISKNQTNRIEMYTESIGHSLALSSLYDGLIECLEEQLKLLS